MTLSRIESSEGSDTMVAIGCLCCRDIGSMPQGYFTILLGDVGTLFE